MAFSHVTRRFALSLGLAAAAVSLSACDDSAGKPKATVADAPKTAAAAPAGGAAPAGATTLAISPESSKIGFVGSKVTGHHDGSFTGFTGKIELTPNVVGSKVSIDIDATSLKTDSDNLTTHLKSPDFFDTAKFPKATFASTAITAGGTNGATHTIAGDLTLHGVTKSVTFPATITRANFGVTATAEFTINRKDFGLVYPGKADDLIKDDVVIKLTIDAKK